MVCSKRANKPAVLLMVLVICVVVACLLWNRLGDISTGSYSQAACAENSYFGFLSLALPGEYGYEASIVSDLPIAWVRPCFGPFIWNNIEPTQGGGYDFGTTDARVKDAQDKGLHILATIWPFAGWDQEYWEQQYGEPEGTKEGAEYGIPNSRRKPYHMDAYRQFVQAIVERYDGDGENDMPGLKYPIKYWEAANEPSHSEYFEGTMDDYFDLLQATYEAVKSADSDAKVLMGGPAPVSMHEFFNELIELGGGAYFDIANMHELPGEVGNSAVFINELLENHGIKRPIWVTECGDPVTENEELQAKNLVKGYVSGFANGVEKVFYNLYETFPMVEGNESLINQALIEDGRKKRMY